MKDYINYTKFKKDILKDPKVKKAYDDLEFEFQIINMLIKKRIEQNLTQAQLATKLGFSQPVIAKLESGNYNPSVKFLHKIAKGLNAKLTIQIS